MINISNILSTAEIKGIIEDPEFYFQKGQDVLQAWLTLEISAPLTEKLLILAGNYRILQTEAEKNVELKSVLETLYKIIAYCDNHAKDKQLYNEYSNKRVLARATVRMNHWIEKLIQLKFNPLEVGSGSPKNAFDYLLNPEMNATILSENHRELVAENLFKKAYVAEQFVEQLKEFYAPYELSTINPINYTHLLSRVTSSIQNKWKEGVIGLMASDNTGWQEDYIKEIDDHEAIVLWNSKKPSGTSDTLKQLRSIINDEGTFVLYYSAKGMVQYKATIIDFAESQDELDSKKWDETFEILHYN